MQLPIHTIESAPPESQPLLEAAQSSFGFVPNLLGVMANAPALLEAYLALSKIFDASSLSPTERQVVLLSASAENGCDYCMAAHSVIAGMHQVDPGVIQSLRDEEAIDDPKLEALRAFAAEVTLSRGLPTEERTRVFLGAGYRSAQALEVVLGVGLKTLSNYTNHLARTPLDSAFESAEWTSANT